jgi:5'-nucleotidase/UDP-sugar diphosphatase
MIKKNFWSVCTFAVLAFSLLLGSCAGTKPVARQSGKSYELVVLHTNDHHGADLATKDGKGGLAAQATFIKQVRAANKNVLLLSAGDLNTGTAFSNMFAAEPDILAYNAMGYDAVAFGNHEFDGPLSKLQKQIKMSKFTWISANIKQGNAYLGKPYIIKDYEGFRVAVIGLTTLRTLVIASPDKSLTFLDEIKTAQEMVDEVRSKEHADIVIICGHLGDIEETNTQETSIKLAQAITGVDLIVDGHSHSFFAEPKIVNNIPIVTANERAKFVGDGVMTIKDGKVVNFAWKPVEITEAVFPPDEGIVKLFAPYVAKSDASLKEVVLKTAAPFEFGKKLTRYQEMASGDVLCDGIVNYLKNTGVTVDFAVSNGGNIRTELPAGDITREQILTMLPFENYVYVLTLKGSDVVELFNFIGQIKQGAGAFAQVSKEVKYIITYDAAGNGTISNVTIGGIAIDPNKTYRIATNDYMANGGDGYVALQKSVDTFNTSMLMSSVFIDYVKSLPAGYKPVTDGRITVVGGKLPE